MRNLMLACAGLAIIAGFVSVNLWQELRADRVLIAELRIKLGEYEQRHARLATTAPPHATDPWRNTTAQPATAEMPAIPTAGPTNPRSSGQEVLKDPEQRNARLAQLRLTLPQSYPGLVGELGLSPEDADKLWTLLAENQLERSANVIPMVNGRLDPEVAEAMSRAHQEKQRKFDDSLVAMLGSSRYQQWQEYQETRPGRQRAVQLGRTLESIGEPLSEAQMRPLTAALIAEQKRQTGGAQGPIRIAGSADPQERARLQEESNRRIIEAAAPQLNARQVETLRAALEQQVTGNRASSRTQSAAGAPVPAY